MGLGAACEAAVTSEKGSPSAGAEGDAEGGSPFLAPIPPGSNSPFAWPSGLHEILMSHVQGTVSERL